MCGIPEEIIVQVTVTSGSFSRADNSLQHEENCKPGGCSFFQSLVQKDLVALLLESFSVSAQVEYSSTKELDGVWD